MSSISARLPRFQFVRALLAIRSLRRAAWRRREDLHGSGALPPPRSFCISPLKRFSQACCAFALLPHLCIISLLSTVLYCAFALLPLLPHRSSQAFALHPHLCIPSSQPFLSSVLCIRPASAFACHVGSAEMYAHAFLSRAHLLNLVCSAFPD